jgi:hypothetical protein
MYCRKCGSPNAESAAFCGVCGSDLGDALVTPPAVPHAAAPPAAAPPYAPPPVGPPLSVPQPVSAAPARQRGWVVAATVAIVALIGGGVFAYMTWAADRATEEQLTTAASFMRASLGKDDATLRNVLPPATVAALPADWYGRYHGDWSDTLRIAAGGARNGPVMTVGYGPEIPDPTVDMVMIFRVKTSGGDDASLSWESQLKTDPSILETGAITLRRLDGVWRVANYRSGDVSYVFWDGDTAPTALASGLDAAVPDQSAAPGSESPSGVPLVPTDPNTVPGSGVDPSMVFDPATATRVPSGQTPKQYVAVYYQAILDKEWDTAFAMQPAASQAGSSVDTFAQMQESYGMVAFSISSSVTGGSEATVVARQDLGSNGSWYATWTFVDDGGTWFVKSRKVSMGEPE